MIALFKLMVSGILGARGVAAPSRVTVDGRGEPGCVRAPPQPGISVTGLEKTSESAANNAVQVSPRVNGGQDTNTCTLQKGAIA